MGFHRSLRRSFDTVRYQLSWGRTFCHKKLAHLYMIYDNIMITYWNDLPINKNVILDSPGLKRWTTAAAHPSWPLGLSGTPRSATGGLEPGTPQVELWYLCLEHIIGKPRLTFAVIFRGIFEASWGHAGAMVGGSGSKFIAQKTSPHGVFCHSAAWGWMVRPSWGVVEWFVSIIPVTIGAPTVTVMKA